MSGTAADVIRIAESQLGQTDGTKYFNYFGAGNLGAWCVAGARWCYAQADVDCHWNHSFQAFDWRDVPSRYAVEPKDLQRGDFVSFDWDEDVKGDHVGIVTGVHDWGIATIEFNTDWGRVAPKQRLWSVVICGIRPTFAQGDGHWVKSGDRWWWQYPNGDWPKSEWKEINGAWYYFDASGWMVTGWVSYGGKWYWCDKTKGSTEGQMLKSAVINDGTGFYALGESGTMLTDVQTNAEHDGTYGRLIL